MRGDIEKFLNVMEEKLNRDILKHIVINHIFSKINMKKIKRQKILKSVCNIELIKFFGILYYDSNFIVYKNKNGQVILENNNMNFSNFMYLYSNIANNTPNNQTLSVAPQQYQQIVDNVSNNINNNLQQTTINSSSNDTNDIVLFENTNSEYLDENGIVRQKKINLSIVYV